MPLVQDSGWNLTTQKEIFEHLTKIYFSDAVLYLLVINIALIKENSCLTKVIHLHLGIYCLFQGIGTQIKLQIL